MKRIQVKTGHTNEAIEEAVSVLRNHGLVVYPTETCYGLGADATDQKAVDKLLAYKRKREGKPLSVLVASQTEAEKLVKLNASAKKLYERFLPGPMTVISEVRKNMLAQGVASELRTLGIRISSHPVAMTLAREYMKPITATSANASYKKKPYAIEDVLKPLSQKQLSRIDLVIDAGRLPNREVSTVVDTTLADEVVLRQGEIRLANLKEKIVSRSEAQTQRLAQTLMLKYWDKMRKFGLVFGLVGNLGAGKTVFAKGVGRFLQIKEPIVSPSYSLVNEYLFSRQKVSGNFFHLDLWRWDADATIKKLGIKQMIGRNSVVVIEWAFKAMKELEREVKKTQAKFVKILIEEKGEREREMRIYDER